jgi:hypothetical protein
MALRKIPEANKRGWSRSIRGLLGWKKFLDAPIATSTYSTIEADHNKFLIKRKLIFLIAGQNLAIFYKRPHVKKPDTETLKLC